MASALIGHTGFVGGVLAESRRFDELYNSKNISDMAGSYGLVVCAGVRAAKWWANQNPEADAAHINSLQRALARIDAEYFVLMSTVDVYGDTVGRDELSGCYAYPQEPYGRHRLELEQFVARRFRNHLIVRLPALFGPGLRKNLLFDLLHDRLLGPINGKARFQWYDLSMLPDEIDRIREAGINLINLATEPISMEEVIQRYFPGAALKVDEKPTVNYDFRTRYARVLGGEGGYLYSAAAVLDRMGKFISEVRSGHIQCGSPYQI